MKMLSSSVVVSVFSVDDDDNDNENSIVVEKKLNPRPTQPSILPGSINEDQLRLGRKRQVWFVPLADERGVCR